MRLLLPKGRLANREGLLASAALPAIRARPRLAKPSILTNFRQTIWEVIRTRLIWTTKRRLDPEIGPLTLPLSMDATVALQTARLAALNAHEVGRANADHSVAVSSFACRSAGEDRAFTRRDAEVEAPRRFTAVDLDRLVGWRDGASSTSRRFLRPCVVESRGGSVGIAFLAIVHLSFLTGRKRAVHPKKKPSRK